MASSQLKKSWKVWGNKKGREQNSSHLFEIENCSHLFEIEIYVLRLRTPLKMFVFNKSRLMFVGLGIRKYLFSDPCLLLIAVWWMAKFVGHMLCFEGVKKKLNGTTDLDIFFEIYTFWTSERGCFLLVAWPAGLQSLTFEADFDQTFFFEGSNDFEPGRVWRLHDGFFFLWTAIQIFEHTLLKRCAHAGPTAQARTLPTLLVCVCVFFVSLIICLQWRLDLDFYMQIWGLELRSCIILSYDVNSFCGAQGTERMDWWDRVDTTLSFAASISWDFFPNVSSWEWTRKTWRRWGQEGREHRRFAWNEAVHPEW